MDFSYWIKLYTLLSVIMNPIRFNKEKNSRSEDVIERLKDVRKAQIAFKEVNRYYASNFDELIPLIDTGVFTIVQRRDEELKFYNKLYREFQLKDTTFIDTLGLLVSKTLFLEKITTYKICDLFHMPKDLN